MKVCSIYIFLVLTTLCSLYSLQISLAEINVEEMFDESQRDGISIPEDFSHDLSEVINGYDKINSIQVNELQDDLQIESLLDASIAAFDSNSFYMLYGTLYIDERWMEARITLYELETDRVRTIFYEKADISRYDDLVRDMGEKIVLYFYDVYDIEPAQVFNEWKGYWEIGGSLGYWGVLPDWNETLSGLVSLQAGISLAFDRPVLFYNHFVIYPKVGFSLSYQPGINKAGFENFVYNSFQLAIPFSICAEWRKKHYFSFQVYPGDQIDWLVQSRLYGDTYSVVSQSMFLAFGITYELLPAGSQWAFGLNQRLDFVFYEDLMVSYKPSIQISYRLEKNANEE